MNTGTYNVTNYLVPSAGQTHAVPFSGVFSATPYTIDWRNFQIDNFPFQPQGAFVDNSQGTGALIINIQPLNYNVEVPAGIVAQVQFPAPKGQVMTVTGNGQASVVFVDFPVLPSSGLTQVANTVNVQIVGSNNGVVIPVSIPVDAQGLPYQVQNTPMPALAYSASISGSATSATITPIANTNLRKLKIALSDNATLATAGNDLLTVTLNGVAIFSEHVYIPQTPNTGIGGYDMKLSFNDFTFSAGESGTLVVTLATALATGYLDINAYFA